MDNFSSTLSETISWLFPTLAWFIACSVIYLILTFPSYYIFWPFFKQVKTRLVEFIEKLSGLFEMRRAKRSEILIKEADKYMDDGGLLTIKADDQEYWTKLIRGILETLKSLRKPVNRVALSLKRLNSRLAKLTRRLKSSEDTSLHDLPNQKSKEANEISEGDISFARKVIVINGFFILAIVVVNTGMLSQILKDLGVVPANMMFIGIPLSYVFAFILTLVEAGIGVSHGISVENKDPDNISLWPTFTFILALMLAFVEGFFYSRIAMPGSVFNVPIVQYAIPQTDLFFYWGFVLVTVLFILGSTGFRAIATVIYGNEQKLMKNERLKLSKAHERYSDALESSNKNLSALTITVKNAKKLIQGPSDGAESIQEQLKIVYEKIDELKNNAPDWVSSKEKKLSRTEIFQLAQQGGLWLLLTVFGIIIVTITGLKSFSTFYPSFDKVMLWILALGQAVVFFGIGVLLSSGPTIVQVGEHGRKVWNSPQFSRLAGYIIGGLLIATYIVLFFTLALPIDMGAIWFSNLLVGLLLIVAGYQLRPLLEVVHIWFIKLWNLIKRIIEFIVIVLLQIFQVLSVILEYVFYLLAYLALIIVQKKKKEIIIQEANTIKKD